jgi:hypothetical protein
MLKDTEGKIQPAVSAAGMQRTFTTIVNFARFIGIKNVFIDMFPVVETTGYVEKRCLKENIACGFNRGDTENIHNDCKFCKVYRD